MLTWQLDKLSVWLSLLCWLIYTDRQMCVCGSLQVRTWRCLASRGVNISTVQNHNSSLFLSSRHSQYFWQTDTSCQPFQTSPNLYVCNIRFTKSLFHHSSLLFSSYRVLRALFIHLLMSFHVVHDLVQPCHTLLFTARCLSIT